jgi:hypothetical protein
METVCTALGNLSELPNTVCNRLRKRRQVTQENMQLF